MAPENIEKQNNERHTAGTPIGYDNTSQDRTQSGSQAAGPNSDPFGTPHSQTPYGQTPQTSIPASTSGSRSHSRSGSRSGTASSTGLYLPGGAKYFKSRRVWDKESIEKPWKDLRDPKEKWVTIIPILGMVLGLIVSGILIWDGLRTVTNHTYCLNYEDDFQRGLNQSVWTREIELGGYGNGQFEETTASNENLWIKDGILTIRPTLQDENLINNDNIVDLRGSGCTGANWSDCVTGTNTTNGTIVNPVKSARINTKLGASIQYGRVEVVAKLPSGDWLWPAIWMLPTNREYGDWPRSGEIDIMESRGNNYTYGQGGNNIVSSALHFGPNFANDGWWRNNVKRQALHTTYSAGWHTYGVEWSEKYIFTYIDTRLLQVMYTHFDESFWDYGHFPLGDDNGTRLENPWAGATSKSAPFDKDFYLILNVAVGGTNGWFKDGSSGKPWLDSSPTAKKDFWSAKDQWYPTWEKQGFMQVKSVKMWQQKGYGSCM